MGERTSSLHDCVEHARQELNVRNALVQLLKRSALKENLMTANLVVIIVHVEILKRRNRIVMRYVAKIAALRNLILV